jgi:murein tripeptide amidase MpaA
MGRKAAGDSWDNGRVMRTMPSLLALALGLASATHAAERKPGTDAVLPPEVPWTGQSLSLAVPAADPWATPAEKAGLLRTPRYDETVAFLRRLVAQAPELRLVSIGRSAEGRDIWMVVASREGADTPQALAANNRPTLLAYAGIHAGEIDGKDAGLMLLRDLTVRGTRRALLDKANWLFIPILSVDGHERFTPFTRINQRGPAEAGWRTNARNLNLNRDFAKLDAPETRALVSVIDKWSPDLHLDLHVTDGSDHQYDVTFGHNLGSGWSPAIERWLEGVYTPAVTQDLAAMGHVPGPLWVASPVEAGDLQKGFVEWIAGARLSTGYGDVRHLPSVLLENHSLKPYPRRVLGAYVFLDASLRALGAHGPALRAAIAEDRGRRAPELPLEFGPPVAGAAPPARATYLGIESRTEDSAVSGGKRLAYTGRPLTVDVPVIRFAALTRAARPAAYWVPAAWTDVIERLGAHGIRMERQDLPREVDVEMLRVTNAVVGPDPFEGHMPVSASFSPERRRERFSAGSVRVPTDQPLGDLAMVLLEPASPDSFFRWGFFLETLQVTEYAEPYVMEPTAERMLASDAALRAEFNRQVAQDPALATPDARLQWLYRRTPYFDERWRLYPVGRER